jgi:hypothetical protein
MAGQSRVVADCFPVLELDGVPHRRRTADGFVAVPGTGRHEALIEWPDHHADLARMAATRCAGSWRRTVRDTAPCHPKLME